MGSCLGCTQSEEGKQNNLVEKDLKEEKKQYNKVKKILFLGSGGSGKSTIFKQLRGIYGKPFNPHERQTFVTHIHEQVITQMKLALDILDEYISGDMDAIIKQNELMYIERKENREENADYDEEEDYEDDMDDNYDDEEYANFSGEVPDLSEQALEAKEYLTSIHYTTYQLNDEIVAALKTLWGEPAIKKMYAIRNITKIEDSSAYFWNKLDMLNDKNYVPDEADILLVRNKTTGATEQKYEVPDGKGSFSIIDVGGQKSERKKWIKCFDSVTAVIFVASLSCYDELMFEDDTTNCMHDSLELFKEICNLQWFVTTPIILFLNKKDLFEKKIHIIPLSTCFAEYTRKPVASHHMDCDSPSNPDAEPEAEDGHTTDEHANLVNEKEMRDDYETDARNYIKQKFVANNSWPQRPIYTHITCATDKDNVLNVFNDVQQIVVANGLQRNNLI
mmetsp:Transcript_27386/g.43333  ORF Transcript_27386/g.43333 Transcript_27386/m.43333 type:complete len:448 (+) Transcript_27386:136-1479(+)